MDSDTVPLPGAGCSVGVLIDLSETAPLPATYTAIEDEEEISIPLTDSIEISRRDSVTPCETIGLELDDGVLSQTGKPAAPKQSDSEVALIEDEVFDFDLPSSPERLGPGSQAAAVVPAEEEVFFGPMGFTEKCIAAGVAEEVVQPLSPLRPDQMVELTKEALSVAYRIANMGTASAPAVKPAPSRTLFAGFSHASAQQQQQSRALFSNETEIHERLQKSEIEDMGANCENASPNKRLKLSSSVSKEAGVRVASAEEGQGVGGASAEKERRRQGTFTKEKPVTELLGAGARRASGSKRALEGTGPRPASKLQAPASRLTRYNNSQPNLAKPKPSSPERRARDGEVSAPAPAARKSLQLPKPSGLPAARGSKLAMPSQRSLYSAQAGGVKRMDRAAPSGVAKVTSTAGSGPATKPQLLQPGQLNRRSFAMGRGKATTTPRGGPMKVPAPSLPKMGDTVERPHNPALAAAANANGNANRQCPSTPAMQRTAVPKTLSSVTSEGSTPSRTSISSSACGSTPGSVNRRQSSLPTPSKRRSSVLSLPPPSPLSMRSSNSSVSNLSMASSDGGDAPVFSTRTSRRSLLANMYASGSKGSCSSSDAGFPEASPMAFKPRKPLVGNTPELPVRKLSKWSPIRRRKPAPLEDEVSMCTKRVTPT